MPKKRLKEEEKKEQIAIYFEPKLLKEIDRTVADSNGLYRNRTHFIELACREKISRTSNLNTSNEVGGNNSKKDNPNENEEE